MTHRLSIYTGLILSTFLVVTLSTGCKSSKNDHDAPPPLVEKPDSKLVKPPTPIEVDNLTATVTSANEVLLTWDAPKKVTADVFEVALCRGHERVEDCSDTELESFDAYKNSLELTNLGPGTLNSFRVTIFSCTNPDDHYEEYISKGVWTTAVLPTWEDKDFQFWCNFPNKSKGLTLTIETILKAMVASTCSEAISEIPGGQISFDGLSYSRNGLFPIDLIPLAYFPNITTLDIDFSQIENLEPLSKLVNLKSLSLAGNLIKDIEPILGLTSLETLDLKMNDSLKDLSEISNLKNLTTLDLSNLSLYYVPDLSGLSKLENLMIDKLLIYDEVSIDEVVKVTFVTDLKWLKGLSNLKTLSAEENLWGWDLTGISQAPALETLRLSRSLVVNLAALKELKNLVHLHLTMTQTKDLSPLASLSHLESLYLEANEISDLSSLPNLPTLYEIDLSNNKIVDVSPLVKIKNLHEIILENNLVEDVSSLLPLEKEPHSFYIDLIGNPIVRTGVCPFENKEICLFSRSN